MSHTRTDFAQLSRRIRTMRFATTRCLATVIAAGLVAASPTLAAGFAGDTRMVRLDAKDPDAQRNRGTREQTRSDLYQIIVYYNAAIRRDPNDDDAYFHRGLAKLYAGALPAAMADLVQASRLDPEYAYYALWIDIIDKRRNEAGSLAQATAHFDMSKWPAPVVRLFLGETTPAAVRAAADDLDPATRGGQLCEANFYSGEYARQHGDMQEAARLFRLAAAGCARDFVEGPAAGAELEALGQSP
jgi:lipoprotein NlpI